MLRRWYIGGRYETFQNCPVFKELSTDYPGF